jgi:hypothetical protein
MKSSVRFGLVFFLTAIAIALPAFAYRDPLTSEDIRNAYFMGRASEEKRGAFFDKYIQHPPAPKTGPYIESIRLETPYAVVVARSATATNYNAPDAEAEFLGKPAIFHLYVHIQLTDTYGWQLPSSPGTVRLRPDDFWRDFNVRLIQRDAEIPSKAVRGEPIYSIGDVVGGSGLIGANVWLEYDAKKIEDETAKVRILTPDGQTVEAEFDLPALK